MDASQAAEVIKGVNIQTLFSLGVMMWYFNRHTNSKIEKIESKLEELVAIQSSRSDKLYQMFIDLLKNKK